MYQKVWFSWQCIGMLCILCATTAGTEAVWGQPASPGQGVDGLKGRPAAVPGVVIVKVDEGFAADKIGVASALNAATAETMHIAEVRRLFSVPPQSDKTRSAAFAAIQQIYEVHYTDPIEPHVAAALLAEEPAVMYAEPRYLYTLDSLKETPPGRRKVMPNDPRFAGMSHLEQVGLPNAWDVVRASDGDATIAIVDGGVDWRHVDLNDNVWRNPRELDNGTDDDANGLVDDLNGWNFANNTNDPSGLDRTPGNEAHGTMVAGIAAAVTDNGTGIAGASWNARFIPINTGCAFTDNAVCFGYEGVLYAASVGADVINISWGGPDSFLGREAIRVARESGALVVVSAGNSASLEGSGTNIDRNPTYPAAYEGVLVVGATTKMTDTKATFSNFGLSVDVFAPGENLDSTLPGDNYTAEASGSSFAAPMVAGLAALVRTQNPGWTSDQIRERIRITSDPIETQNEAFFDGLLGQGRINAAQAISDIAVPAVRVRSAAISDSGRDGAIQEGEAIDIRLDLENILDDAEGLTMTVTTEDTLVTLINAASSLGSLRSGEQRLSDFSFVLDDEVPNDHTLFFRVQFEGAAYSDTQLLSFTANRITHDTGVVQVSLTDDGNVGWSGFQQASEGQGFLYFGVDWLFEGGLMVGLGEDRVLSSVRNERPMEQDDDFIREENSLFGVLGGRVTTEDGLAVFVDKEGAEGSGLRIQQESFADTQSGNRNFIILRYILSQSEDAVALLNEVYVGLFMDWDLTVGGDFARYDARQRLGIVQPSAEDPVLLLGTKLLTPGAGVSYRSIRNEEIFDTRSGGDGFTEQEKWDFLSDGIQQESVDNDDVSTLITAGPYRLQPGDRVEAAFALIAATRAEDMVRYAGNAQQLWNQTLQNLGPNTVAVDPGNGGIEENTRLTWLGAYPNPISEEGAIRFSMPASGHVELAVYDMLGRKINVLLDATVPSGVHIVTWDGRNHSNNPVSNGTYVYRAVASIAGRAQAITRPVTVIR